MLGDEINMRNWPDCGRKQIFGAGQHARSLMNVRSVKKQYVPTKWPETTSGISSIYFPTAQKLHTPTHSESTFSKSSTRSFSSLVTSVQHIILCARKRCSKIIPPNTSWLGVREDRLPASEDTVDGWTASTRGIVMKGFEFGVESSTASAA